MSFTREEIIEEFEDAQWYGRRPHKLQMVIYEARRWWQLNGQRQANMPEPATLSFNEVVLIEVVNLHVARKPTAQRQLVLSHGVQTNVCELCGVVIERREGSNMTFHLGKNPCPNRRYADRHHRANRIAAKANGSRSGGSEAIVS